MMVNIAVIGDVHRHFSAEDVAYFNGSDYDLILVVGDLANWWPNEGHQVARTLSQLKRPCLVIPGNHDTVTAYQLLAEIKQYTTLMRLSTIGQGRRERTLRRALGPVTFCGYSTHAFDIRENRFDVVAARPYSMGGPNLGFKHRLKQVYGITSIEASAERLKRCLDQATSGPVIILAHNGPFGLGATRKDIWGCDFRPEGGDYGDVDLKIAIKYARGIGKRVICVVAGHMHQQLLGGGQRRWQTEKDGIHYLNAACVPRIFRRDGRIVRHHVRLKFDESTLEVEQVLVS
jgi:uncharacterized protein (TIGR04168 family)